MSDPALRRWRCEGSSAESSVLASPAEESDNARRRLVLSASSADIRRTFGLSAPVGTVNESDAPRSFALPPPPPNRSKICRPPSERRGDSLKPGCSFPLSLSLPLLLAGLSLSLPTEGFLRVPPPVDLAPLESEVLRSRREILPRDIGCEEPDDAMLTPPFSSRPSFSTQSPAAGEEEDD